MKRRSENHRRRRLWGAVAAAIVMIALLSTIDDWGRDFTQNEAAISATSPDPSLRPVVSDLPNPDLADAVKGAAGRIRNWTYAGEAFDGSVSLVLFVRTSRLLRWKDDVTVRIEDLGDRSRVTAESRSRASVGDLGRNPRTLRRFREELEAVLRGAASRPRTGYDR